MGVEVRCTSPAVSLCHWLPHLLSVMPFLFLIVFLFLFSDLPCSFILYQYVIVGPSGQVLAYLEKLFHLVWGFVGFSCGSAGKQSACNARDLRLIPGLGRSPGKGKGCPLQHSGLENSMNCIVHGVPNSWTLLSDFHFSSHQYCCPENPTDRRTWQATSPWGHKEVDITE